MRFGDAPRLGGGRLLGAAVAGARTPDGDGYWIVDAGGRVAARGDARRYGDLLGVHLTAPVVGMAATPAGLGYWLVSRTGRVWAFGDARRFGSKRNVGASAPIVGIAPSAPGQGYYLAAADGEVLAFGPADPAGRRARARGAATVAIASTRDGRGYWLVGADGSVITSGDAPQDGSLAARRVQVADVVSVAPTPNGSGYWLVRATGAVYGFGAAADHGSTAPDPADRRTVTLLSDADGQGYWEVAAPVVAPRDTRRPAEPRPVRTALGTFSVTCYTGGGTTASGAPTSLTDVAVDPSVIPLGTTITISGVGTRTAQDTGGAIVGKRLDIWEPTETGCIDWGRRNEQVWKQS